MGEGKYSRHEPTNLSDWKDHLNFLYKKVAGVELLVVIIGSTIVTGAVSMMDHDNQWRSFFSESTAAVATLGALYSFALVFRTNICYSRWWEGRVLWGQIIVYSIRMAQQSQLWIHHDEMVSRMNGISITFAYACKALLRGNSLDDEEEEGARLVEEGLLSQAELDVISGQKAWQPYYCIDVMRCLYNEAAMMKDNKGLGDNIRNGAFISVEQTVCGLASSIGGCIRVQSTGLPKAYDDILNTIGCIFFTFATIAWAPSNGLYNPVIIFFIYLVIKMIVGVGNDMEDPFGYDASDLPLEQFCDIVKYQIYAIQDRNDKISYNLANGPAPSSENKKTPLCSTSWSRRNGDIESQQTLPYESLSLLNDGAQSPRYLSID